VSRGVVLWDFDGTLAWRPGLWGGCILEILDEQAPGHSGTLENIRRTLKGAFPWNRHERSHPEISGADEWWGQITLVLSNAIVRCGVETARADELARAVRVRFVDGTRGWRVFPDTRHALTVSAGAGLRNVVLSNHVPELELIMEQLGLSELVEHVFSSALIGYEKPHPEAFRHALHACGDPSSRWMVGDNPVADVAGAEVLGIPAVLVRTAGDARRTAPDAAAAAALIAAHR
jgi:putative hydrolase of the HAD superfamily